MGSCRSASSTGPWVLGLGAAGDHSTVGRRHSAPWCSLPVTSPPRDLDDSVDFSSCRSVLYPSASLAMPCAPPPLRVAVLGYGQGVAWDALSHRMGSHVELVLLFEPRRRLGSAARARHPGTLVLSEHTLYATLPQVDLILCTVPPGPLRWVHIVLTLLHIVLSLTGPRLAAIDVPGHLDRHFALGVYFCPEHGTFPAAPIPGGLHWRRDHVTAQDVGLPLHQAFVIYSGAIGMTPFPASALAAPRVALDQVLPIGLDNSASPNLAPRHLDRLRRFLLGHPSLRRLTPHGPEYVLDFGGSRSRFRASASTLPAPSASVHRRCWLLKRSRYVAPADYHELLGNPGLAALMPHGPTALQALSATMPLLITHWILDTLSLPTSNRAQHEESLAVSRFAVAVQRRMTSQPTASERLLCHDAQANSRHPGPSLSLRDVDVLRVAVLRSPPVLGRLRQARRLLPWHGTCSQVGLALNHAGRPHVRGLAAVNDLADATCAALRDIAPRSHYFTTFSICVGVGQLPLEWCLAAGNAVLLNLSTRAPVQVTAVTGRSVLVRTFRTLQLGYDSLITSSRRGSVFCGISRGQSRQLE